MVLIEPVLDGQCLHYNQLLLRVVFNEVWVMKWSVWYCTQEHKDLWRKAAGPCGGLLRAKTCS